MAPIPFSQVRPIIEDYCGCLEEVFATVEEEPIGSASIALVYRGELRDGTKVALKVQRPNIAEMIEKDLVILQALAKRVEIVFPDLRVYNPSGMVQDFATQIRKELDFVRDGRNADCLGQNMKGMPGVRCPKIYWRYSGARLLVMEYIEGVRVDDREGIRAFGLNPREIGKKGFYAYMKQIFEDGFFHGDPHPGNLIVTRKGDLVFLDFGIMGIIRPEKRNTFMNLIGSILGNDVDLMIRSLEHLGVRMKPDQMEGLRDDLFIILMDYNEFELKDVNFSRVIQELTTVMRRYNMQVPMTVMLMLKVILMVADIGRSLDPEVQLQLLCRALHGGARGEGRCRTGDHEEGAPVCNHRPRRDVRAPREPEQHHEALLFRFPDVRDCGRRPPACPAHHGPLERQGPRRAHRGSPRRRFFDCHLRLPDYHHRPSPLPRVPWLRRGGDHRLYRPLLQPGMNRKRAALLCHQSLSMPPNLPKGGGSHCFFPVWAGICTGLIRKFYIVLQESPTRIREHYRKQFIGVQVIFKGHALASPVLFLLLLIGLYFRCSRSTRTGSGMYPLTRRRSS